MAEIITAIIIASLGSTGLWTAIQTAVQNFQRKKSNDSKLMMGIGYSKIIDLCEKHIANGYITTREFHELEHYLYEPYRSMGGNGTVENLFEQVRELPIKPEKGAKKK